MTEPNETSNVPATLAASLAGVPAALVPACVKALDRLIGAAVDIPVAWLKYHEAKIVSRTEGFRTIEAAIVKNATTKVEAADGYADRVLNDLVRKQYRHTENKQAVGAAMLEHLGAGEGEDNSPPVNETVTNDIDDDWLNVFERYAEDASTERMQRLWGRVIAGEVRKPGKYSMRTLRFLSEFSQADALAFSEFCAISFGDFAPTKLAKPDDEDIRSLIYLESSGLIQGATNAGLTVSINYNPNGQLYIRESGLGILIQGEPNTKFVRPVITLTPLGQELLTLLPGRDARAAARRVAEAMRDEATKSAYLVSISEGGAVIPMEILWQEVLPTPPITNPS